MSSINNMRTAAITADAFRSKMLKQERREKAAEQSIHEESIKEYNQSVEKDSHLVEQMTSGIRDAVVNKEAYVYRGSLSEMKEQILLSAPGMEELEVLMLLVPEMEGKKEILEQFASELDDDKEVSDDKKASSLKEYVANNCSGLADSYLSLCFLLEMLSQHESKKRWRKYLENTIKKLQKDHYNELFEYFSGDVTNNNTTTSTVNTKTREALSKTRSGEIRFANVKQIIDFIEQYLENDFSQMLAFYLKAKAKSMMQLAKKANNFESKAESAEIRATEARIFNLNSFYAQVTKWRLAMKNKTLYSDVSSDTKVDAKDATAINISDNDAKVLRAVLEFFEFGFVSDMSINSLSFKCINGSLSVKQQIKLICGLTAMLNKLPISLFNNDEKLVGDLKKSLNKLIIEKDKQVDKTKTWLDNLFKEQNAKMLLRI